MFQRSGNVEVLPPASFGKDPIKRPPHGKVHKDKSSASQVDGDLPRAASYSTLPTPTEPPPESTIKRTFSENVLAVSDDGSEKNKVPAPTKAALRRPSLGGRPAKPEFEVHDSRSRAKNTTPTKRNGTPKKTDKEEVDPPKTPSRSISGTVRRFSRKSWGFSPSRSPSPSRPEKDVRQAEKSKRKSFSRSVSNLIQGQPQIITSKPEVESPEGIPDPSPSPPKRTRTKLNGRRPLSAILTRTKSESDWQIPRTPSVQSLRSLRSQKSTESLVLPKSLGRMPSVKVPQIPASVFSEKSGSLSVEVAKKKDPLWTAFRALEADFQKFQAKSSALKANVLRTQLLPFLSRYAKHPSNQSLRAEDLDRRVMVLNKWWIGLLEMLNGKNNQSVSGMDRPVFLEGVTGIMIRPEWRIPPFPNSPSNSPQPRRLVPNPSRSTTSLESNGSDFLTESIFNNVRNIFNQNLLSQMSFVVDKMSMRTAPASLVAFCGKACAYAFVFCPRVADILVRLWSLSPATLKHIYAEFEIPRVTNMQVPAKELAGRFPPSLRGLCVTSASALNRYLRQQTPLPVGSGYINWHGPWKARWSGRDSDLFFVFAKHFHSLVVEFLPADTPKRNRACVPGLIPVHAQMLAILDSTIYRQAGQQQQFEVYASSMFDDLESPDAPAATVPLTSANAARSMAENRLVMVLRDVLADSSPELHLLREFYAESFGGVLKAAAKKISLYNANACFVLLDFMEEVLAIMHRFSQKSPLSQALDWSFWLRVCQSMMESQNSLTEVRLFAFIYSTWSIITSNEERKRIFCLGWLLDENFFQRHFNHWCPMVRSYYLRLLCWRMARCDGEATDLDNDIFDTLLRRLNETWAYFLFLRDDAEKRNTIPPSTAPCSPAPGRRIVIIRNDSLPIANHFFGPFDRVMSFPASAQQDGVYRASNSILSNVPTTATPPMPERKRWNILKNIIPFNSPGNTRPGEVTPPSSSSDDSSPVPEDTSLTDSPGAKTPTTRSRPLTPPAHQQFSFKFSLEWLDRPAWPSKNRRLFGPKLPPPAQAALEARQSHETNGQIIPRKPNLQDTKYAGRALAEWAQVVSECQGFFERRMQEGVPTLKMVETPTLGVESFRMNG